MAARPCAIEDCGGLTGVPGTARGWCTTHYQRWQRNGDPLKLQDRSRSECAVDDCSKVALARGWCAMHYWRWCQHGTVAPRLRGDVRDGKRVCARCRQDLPVALFGLRTRTSTGRSPYCQLCTRAIARDWRRQNPDYVQPRPPLEVLAAEARAYRRRHPERTAEIARSHASRRRAARRGAAAERFTHREIFERDDWICQICMDPIDREARAPDPLSPSLDHRIPLARNGVHTRANCQAAHLRCNLRKHAKVPEVAS